MELLDHLTESQLCNHLTHLAEWFAGEEMDDRPEFLLREALWLLSFLAQDDQNIDHLLCAAQLL